MKYHDHMQALAPNFTPRPQRVVISVWRHDQWVAVDPTTYIQPQHAGVKAAALRIVVELDRHGFAYRIRFAHAQPGERDMFAIGAYRAPLDDVEIVYAPTDFQHPDGRWAAAVEIGAAKENDTQPIAA